MPSIAASRFNLPTSSAICARTAAAAARICRSTSWRRVGITEQELRTLRGGDKFRELMRFQITAPTQYYEKSSPLERYISRDSRPTMIAMTDIYRGLLKKVAYEPERVLREARVAVAVFQAQDWVACGAGPMLNENPLPCTQGRGQGEGTAIRQ